MASMKVFNKLSLLLTVVALFTSGAIAQSSSGGISSCASTVMSLSPCLSNNTRSSSRPSSACCSALSNVVEADPQCLCSVLNNGAGSTIGMILPLTFPRACNIQTTTLSQCSAPSPSSVPSAMAPSSTTPSGGKPLADSPTGSPNEVEPEAPSSDFPTDTGTKNLPPFTGSFTNGGITKHSCNLLVVVLIVVSWFSAAAPF